LDSKDNEVSWRKLCRRFPSGLLLKRGQHGGVEEVEEVDDEATKSAKEGEKV
jgi:hypothetical protein